MHGNPGDPSYQHGSGGGGSSGRGGRTPADKAGQAVRDKQIASGRALSAADKATRERSASPGAAGIDTVQNVNGEPHYATGKVGTAVGSGEATAEFQNADGTNRVWIGASGKQSGDGETKRQSLARPAADKVETRRAAIARGIEKTHLASEKFKAGRASARITIAKENERRSALNKNVAAINRRLGL